MKKEDTVRVRRTTDGKFAKVLPDGDTKPLASKTDWSRLEAMSDEDIHAAAVSDPDAQPLTEEQLKKMRRLPFVKVTRQRLGLSQEAFAKRFKIPLGTLRDWEQGRSEPDKTVQAYLTVIAKRPNIVRDALAQEPQP